MKIVLLAGGKGLRIQEETQNKPKPLIKINGIPIIQKIIEHYLKYNFRDFLILGGYKYEQLEEYFNGFNLLNNINIKVIDTGEETLTAGRLLYIKNLLNETFMLTYSDGISDINLIDLLNFHKSHGKIGTVSAMKFYERFGILNIGMSGTVLNFDEKCISDRCINGGFFVFEPEIFNYINGDVMLEKELLINLVKLRELKAYRHNGFFKCMDTYKDKLELEKYFKGKINVK